MEVEHISSTGDQDVFYAHSLPSCSIYISLSTPLYLLLPSMPPPQFTFVLSLPLLPPALPLSYPSSAPSLLFIVTLLPSPPPFLQPCLSYFTYASPLTLCFLSSPPFSPLSSLPFPPSSSLLTPLLPSSSSTLPSSPQQVGPHVYTWI